ncbi:MAG: AMP-binding protein [bacterium]|nr:AMP-binding protein [bacterium]
MNTSVNYFWQKLKNFSDHIACTDTSIDKSITYTELETDSDKIADKIKISKKAFIFLFTSNSYDCIAAYIGILKSGNAVLLLDENLNNEIRNNLIEIYNPDLIITSRDLPIENYYQDYKHESLLFLKRNNFFDGEIYPDLAVLLSTSGTTGSPKLVRLTYKNIQSNAESISDYLKIDSKERPITTLPFNYSFGLSVINSHLLKGASIILTNKTVFFREFWSLFNNQKCTSFAGVPYTYTMLKRINFETIELPTLKTMTQAGGKLSEEFIRHFDNYSQKQNVKFFVMYGQTEATARISYVPADQLSKKIGSIGIAIPGGELKIVNDGSEVTSVNEVGEIVYKGDNVMLGYAENRNDLSKADELNGILYTGDLGYKDEDGFFYVTGRMKRFLKIFGLRVNLDEIQKMIENRFGFSVACTGKDDLLKVLILSDDPIVEVNVKNEILKTYKLNFKTVVVKSATEIPTTSSGKYDYNRINALFEN